ncbi:acyl-CoA dehydrogenase [bacterium]|nr:MAG: acyl-CoA dehydrogenase [bacterium]
MNTDEYARFRDQAFRAMWELAALEKRIEDEEQVPYELVMPALRRMGAFGMLVPEAYGGAGLTISQYLPILTELAKVHGAIRVIVHVHNSFAHALFELGTDRQRQAMLPGVATGELSIAFALTEPDHGTGMDTGTVARTDGTDFLVTGRKWLITNSDFASHFIVFAQTPDEGKGSLSAILVERGTRGFTIEPVPETMGCKGGQHGLLTFANARVPRENLLGGAAGQGPEQLERALEISRVFIAASSLGTAEYALELALRHAQTRVTFGRPIAERQAVQRYLAEMATDVHALRHMLADAASAWDAGKRIPAQSAMCKLFGLEAVGRVTDRALLVAGGIGYTRATPIERLYRDARLNWLEEGPPTVQYMVAARELINGFWWDGASRHQGQIAGASDGVRSARRPRARVTG